MTATLEGPGRDDWEFFAEAARQATRNAAALVIEADLLLREGHFARALALSVASLEEDAKQSAFWAQATEYDPEFRARLKDRLRNDIYSHGAKQRQAVQSLRNLFDPVPLDPPDQQPQNPIAHIDLDAAEAEMKSLRESALYVTVWPTLESPLDSVTEEQATKYVEMATASAYSRRWVHGSDTSTIADLLEFYRETWLAHGGPDMTSEQVAVAWTGIREAVFENFGAILDDTGRPASLYRKTPPRR